MTLISPIRIYKDLDLGLAPHPITQDVARRMDVNAVKQSLKTLLMTNFYERLFHPEIGTPIRRLLFDPIDTITTQALKQAIERAIQNWEPRIRLIALDVIPKPDESAYDIQIEFNIVGIGAPVTFTTVLKRLR